VRVKSGAAYRQRFNHACQYLATRNVCWHHGRLLPDDAQADFDFFKLSMSTLAQIPALLMVVLYYFVVYSYSS